MPISELDQTERHDDRAVYWDLVSKLPSDGLWAEFGVATGRSCRHWLKRQNIHLYCFDSWQGLPENWDTGQKVLHAGAFAGAVPGFLRNDKRVTIVKGFVKDTLPYEFSDELSFCHIDTDLYSSADTILRNVDPYLVEGCVIAFDEMWDNAGGKYPAWKEGEYKAYCEWKERTGKTVDWVYQTVGGSVGWIRE